MMDSQTINQNKFLLHKFSEEGARERKKEERERERAEKGQERKRRDSWLAAYSQKRGSQDAR